MTASSPSFGSPPPFIDGFFAMGVKGAHQLQATASWIQPSGSKVSCNHDCEVAVKQEYMAGYNAESLMGKWARIPLDGCFSASGPIQLIEPLLPTTTVDGIPSILVSCKLEGKLENHWLLNCPYLGDVIDISNVFERYGEKPIIGKMYKVWVLKWLVKLRSGQKIFWRVSIYQGAKAIQKPSTSTASSKRAEKQKVARKPRPLSNIQSSDAPETKPSSTHNSPVPPIRQSCPDVVPKSDVKSDPSSGTTTTAASAAERVSNHFKKLKIDESTSVEQKMEVLLRRILTSRDVRRAIESTNKALYEEIIDRIV